MACLGGGGVTTTVAQARHDGGFPRMVVSALTVLSGKEVKPR